MNSKNTKILIFIIILFIPLLCTICYVSKQAVITKSSTSFEAYLESKYPGHKFKVEKIKYGECHVDETVFKDAYDVTDENGITFRVYNVKEDGYIKEYNDYFYHEKLQEYKNKFVQEMLDNSPYFSSEPNEFNPYNFTYKISDKEFYNSLEDAINYDKTELDIWVDNIDLSKLSDNKIDDFAESAASSLIDLQEKIDYEYITIKFYNGTEQEISHDIHCLRYHKGDSKEETIENIKNEILNY